MKRITLALVLLAAAAAPPAHAASNEDEALRLNDAGIAAIQAGDYPKAIQLFTRARGLLPLDLTVRKNLATARSKYGAALLGEERVDDAIREFRLAKALEPGLAVHHANLGIALIRAGHDDEGRKSLEMAILVDKKCAPALTELGALCYRKGDLPQAISCWERAVAVVPDRKDIVRALARAKREYEIEKNHRTEDSEHFTISWDGEKDGTIGASVLRMLEDVYDQIGTDLGIRPEERVRVILYTGEEFHEVTGAHAWVGGLYDGRIRIPVKNYLDAERSIRGTIRHEYTHVAIHSVAPTCPAWLNEGLAQWYEGRTANAVASSIRSAKKARTLIPLSGLRRSFTRFADEERARLAYAESLSFTAFLLDAFGPEKIGRYLRALGSGESEEEAASTAFSRDLAGQFTEWLGKLE